MGQPWPSWPPSGCGGSRPGARWRARPTERCWPGRGNCSPTARRATPKAPFRATRSKPLSSNARLSAMCRSIHTLYNFEPLATEEEVRAAALQYVRKISGFAKPSRANEEAFERAVEAVAAASNRLLGELVTSAPPKDREV